MKLLMHTCCAPCSVYCISELRKEGIEPVLYWYNPNIHPYKEYEARRECLKVYSEKVNVEAIFEDEYGLDDFCKNVSACIETRCVTYCYPVRLRKTFEYAKEHGYTHVTSTLLYSIYQKHDFIKKLMEQYSKEFGIEFLYRDFRYGFWEGHDRAVEEGLYMQKYCGCIFSEEDRYCKPNNEKPTLPEGYEYPRRKSVCVKKILNKQDIEDFLMEEEIPVNIINKYIDDSDAYCLQVEGKNVSIAIVKPIDKEVLELKSLITKKEEQKKGYAKKLLKSLCGSYKQKYRKIIVGITENIIPFYVKEGFDNYEKTAKNYFTDNFDKEYEDDDFRCDNLYYYSKNLQKK